MMCEGDIAEIYNFQSINLKMPISISIISAILIAVNFIAIKLSPNNSILHL